MFGHVGLSGGEVPTVTSYEAVLPAGGTSDHGLGSDICVCLLQTVL